MHLACAVFRGCDVSVAFLNECPAGERPGARFGVELGSHRPSGTLGLADRLLLLQEPCPPRPAPSRSPRNGSRHGWRERPLRPQKPPASSTPGCGTLRQPPPTMATNAHRSSLPTATCSPTGAPKSTSSRPASKNSSTRTPTHRSSNRRRHRARRHTARRDRRLSRALFRSRIARLRRRRRTLHPRVRQTSRRHIPLGLDQKLRDAICDFAGDTQRKPWANQRFRELRASGKRHPHAERILARTWCHVIWRCWQDRVRYDPAKHRTCKTSNPPRLDIGLLMTARPPSGVPH